MLGRRRTAIAECRTAGVGLGRSTVLAAGSLLVPAIWGGLVYVAVLWSGDPWSWIALVVLAGVAALLLARPVATGSRRLLGRWSGIELPAGYRRAQPVTRMSTGYWWNGYSYSRSEKDAVQEQRWRSLVGDPAYWRDVRWLPVAAVAVGLPAAVPPAALVGAIVAFAHPTPAPIALGVLLLVLAAGTARYPQRLAGPVAVRWLGPSAEVVLSERVLQLTAQRADATAAQAAEIRRIERDLHDGAQARLVALGLSLATAEKLVDDDPERAKALLREARTGTSASLASLRELVRGIHPPVLTERGLVEAVRALALDVPMDVAVSSTLDLRTDAPIEAALYFGVAELLTNAAKHAGAGRAAVRLTRTGGEITVEVDDDGRGGAEVRPGGGLDGIRGRLAAFDGTLSLVSPAGGPTTVRMVVPCASS